MPGRRAFPIDEVRCASSIHALFPILGLKRLRFTPNLELISGFIDLLDEKLPLRLKSHPSTRILPLERLNAYMQLALRIRNGQLVGHKIRGYAVRLGWFGGLGLRSVRRN